MPSTNKFDAETRDIAETAKELALNLQVSNGVQAIMLEAIIKILSDKGLLTKTDLQNLFYHCHTLIVRSAKGTPLADNPALSEMAEICKKVANVFHIDLEALVRTNPQQNN
jgi:hypothetical protein